MLNHVASLLAHSPSVPDAEHTTHGILEATAAAALQHALTSRKVKALACLSKVTLVCTYCSGVYNLVIVSHLP